MSTETLRQVTDALRVADSGLSASEVAETMGASRVTARRYLEHLADEGLVERAPRYGGSGRPEVEYRWRR
jgi:response regulator of citrate/malate metabolism